MDWITISVKKTCLLKKGNSVSTQKNDGMDNSVSPFFFVGGGAAEKTLDKRSYLCYNESNVKSI